MSRKRRKPSRKWWFRRNILNILVALSICLLLTACTVGVKALCDDITEIKNIEVHTPIVRVAIPEEITLPEVTEFYYDIPLDNELQDHIRELCDSYEVPMELVIAMIHQESWFTTDIVSKGGDYGLMQINSVNHEWLQRELGVTDFLDPHQNVLCGIHIIAGHLEATEGNIELALMRYNCGATGAKRLWNKGVYGTDYTRKVMSYYEVYKKESEKI